MKTCRRLQPLRHKLNLFAAGLLSTTALVLKAGTPPTVQPTTSFNSQAVFLEQSAAFTVTATGDAPFSYQWRHQGTELSGQTNRSLRFTAAQPTDDGNYDVVVSNTSGSVTSYVARLHVVPPASQLIRSNFTNTAGVRLPYVFHQPTDYDPSRRYPLIVQFHGNGGIDETTVTSYFPAQFYIHTSYARQTLEPTIVVYPTRRVGNDFWTPQYIAQVRDLVDALTAAFSIDTDRLYVVGTSEGVHAAWDLLGLRPGQFAAATQAAGWKGSSPASTIKDVPVWVWQAADDPEVNVSQSRTLVQALRQTGGHPIYTEFQTGGHPGGMGPGLMSPEIYGWLMAQRRGLAAVGGPELSINLQPGLDPVTTAALSIGLAGSADGTGRLVTRVSWENATSRTRGDAVGTNDWTIAAVPLTAYATNAIVVTAATASGFPVNGGTTTFSDTVSVFSTPIRTRLALQATGTTLSWSGGVGPYQVQRATDLGVQDWQTILTNSLSPLMLGAEGLTGFYRVVEQ